MRPLVNLIMALVIVAILTASSALVIRADASHSEFGPHPGDRLVIAIDPAATDHDALTTGLGRCPSAFLRGSYTALWTVHEPGDAKAWKRCLRDHDIHAGKGWVTQAFVEYDEKAIFIRPGHPDEAAGDLLHEIGHVLYHWELTDAQRARYQGVWAQECKNGPLPSAYGGTDVEESFCEDFRARFTAGPAKVSDGANALFDTLIGPMNAIR